MPVTFTLLTPLRDCIRYGIRIGFTYALRYTIGATFAISFIGQVIGFDEFPLALIVGTLYGLMLLPGNLAIGMVGGTVFGLIHGIIITPWIILRQYLTSLPRWADTAYWRIVRGLALVVQLGLVIMIFWLWIDDVTHILHKSLYFPVTLFFTIPACLTIPAAWQVTGNVIASALGHPADPAAEDSWQLPRASASLRSNPQRWYL